MADTMILVSRREDPQWGSWLPHALFTTQEEADEYVDEWTRETEGRTKFETEVLQVNPIGWVY